MLLVDDDEPEVGERQEERRARPHHQPRVAGRHRRPGPPPRRLRHPRVPLRRPRPEARLHPVEELHRERDLRQEHQRLPPPRQRLGHRLEIDLGLARPGHALEQRRGIPPRRHRGPQPRRRLRLRGRKRPRRRARVERRIGRVARRVLAHQHPLRLQPLHHRRRDPGALRQLQRREAEVAELGEGGQHPRPRLGHPLRLAPGAAQDRPRRRRPAQARRPRGQPQHHRQRRHGIVGRPREELAHRRRQRRHVEHPRHVAQPARIEVAAARAPDQPEHPPRPQRHLDEVARPRAARRRPVVEQPVEALRRHHRDRRAPGEDLRGIGRIEVFHRAIPWASIPHNHKG